MQAAAERIRVVFGPAFPVLPPFTLGGEVASEWTASLEDQQALHGKRRAEHDANALGRSLHLRFTQMLVA
jgi:hypothetical protein